jgi:hypothetical protein
MTIDADVGAIARYFGVDPALLQALVRAEGNIVRAVQCSFRGVTTRDEALRIAARSSVHAMVDWIKSGGAERQGEFVDFWGRRWAPVRADNDPGNLNANWARNVQQLWSASLQASEQS